MVSKERIQEVLKDCRDAAEVLAEDPNFVTAIEKKDEPSIKQIFVRTMRQFAVQQIAFDSNPKAKTSSGLVKEKDFQYAEAWYPTEDRTGHILGYVHIRKFVTEKDEDIVVNEDQVERKEPDEEMVPMPSMDESGLLLFAVLGLLLFFLMR